MSEMLTVNTDICHIRLEWLRSAFVREAPSICQV